MPRFRFYQAVLITIDASNSSLFSTTNREMFKEIEEVVPDDPKYLVFTKIDLRPDLRQLDWQRVRHLFFLRKNPKNLHKGMSLLSFGSPFLGSSAKDPSCQIWCSLPQELFQKILLCTHSGILHDSYPGPTQNQIDDLINQLGIPVFFVSSKTGEGVHNMFEKIAKKIIEEDQIYRTSLPKLEV